MCAVWVWACMKTSLSLTFGSASCEVIGDDERGGVPFAEDLAHSLQRLAQQQLSGSEVTLVLQQHAEVVQGAERVRMPIAERLAPHLQRLAQKRLSGGEVALAVQQLAHVVDGGERARVPIAEGLALHLKGT